VHYGDASLPARPPILAPFPPRSIRGSATRCARAESRSSIAQARAWDLIAKGQNVVVVTPTASGKTLCYNLPALQALVHQPDARILYLFPTKALAQDQLAELEELARQLPEMRMFTYDGDTPQDARRAVRARANLVLTNPDMLHSGILPHHTKWASLFQNLRYVVIDELHAYRGVFGSHLANVLRRLRRICRHYGSAPVHHGVRDDRQPGSWPAAHRRAGRGDHRERRAHRRQGVRLLQPARRQPRARHPRAVPRRGGQARPAILREKIATIIFAQSRLATEVLLTAIKSGVADKTGDSGIVRGYRGGYLPTRRRAVEKGLREGEVLGVVRPTRSSSASTSATSTSPCSPAIPAGSRRSGSRPGAPDVAAAGPRPSWSRRARRWISSWSRIPNISSERRPSTRA
jgi:DEAD/DEAH box helicase domain-containing protein